MKRSVKSNFGILFFMFIFWAMLGAAQSYNIVDTGQTTFYNNSSVMSAPSAGEAFYGQDAQFAGFQPSYTDNGDGTITDNVTGLMWQKSSDLNGDGKIDVNDKLTYSKALAGASNFALAGYDDWRLPTIKELYSLILFTGEDPSGYTGISTSALLPFIDTDAFDIGFGDTSAGERIIDSQFATCTKYVSTTMNGAETMFGVNFVDGRIKGYPTGPMPGQSEGKGFYVHYVRGNTSYGLNEFVDNGDGTITDNATGLMWQHNDSQEAMNWQEALAWVQQKNSKNYLGYNDWRLPNVKELQSIVDYSRAPAITNSPAIDPLFSCTAITDEGGDKNYPCYWSGTTHVNMRNGGNAAYVAFGEGLGWMSDPMGLNYTLMDVHGAGCQRSDPKNGDPNDYPYGHGPQGDVIRIYNYARLVRDAQGTETGMQQQNSQPIECALQQNYPNPFNPSTTIRFDLPDSRHTLLQVFNSLGQRVATLVNRVLSAGIHNVQWHAAQMPSGIYYYNLTAGSFSATKQMLVLK